ncbi:hypothetical protein WJ69_34370 [Burkholderia ubonensis]|uniref:Flp family type IVb pilin n=1 Tax=Burkholderia ubonensis TaxID=101571 RepID=UPI00075D384F|nr:Flp family type IVb pilin [Burkholderia ubonensis]KVN98539.1 hypothetical protein WJ69_34370 [Burkholderia ubonensis]
MNTKIKNTIGAFLKEEDGVTMVEYGLIAALIAAVCMVAIQSIGTDLNSKFKDIADLIKGAK